MEEKKEFKKEIGLLNATSLVAGSMIGSGIFIVTSIMARDIGGAGWILLAWILTGFLTLAAALSYGELAGMMPTAGGQYVYIQRAYGKMMSFLYGWTVFAVVQTGVIAAVAVAFAKYTAVFFPVLSESLIEIGSFKIQYQQLLAIVSIVVLTFINNRGVKTGKNLQFVFTAAKIFALFALIVFGLYVGLQSNTLSENFTNMWSASHVTVKDGIKTTEVLTGFAIIGMLGFTIINSLFSSDAWNNITFIAGEIKEPQKNIPKSLILGTLIVTIVYLLANLAYFALLPLNGNHMSSDLMEQGIKFANEDRIGASAASVIFGNAGVFIMAALIMVSTFGCNSGLILAGGRLFYAMSKDGLFFKSAGELNKNNVPEKALWLQCIWASVLCLSGKYGDLLTYATFANLLFYILTIYGIFILRKKEPDTPRPYKALGYPVVPSIYIILVALICIDLLIYDTSNTGLGLLIVLLGIPIFNYMQKKAA
ncbi:APC family permease [Flavobacterium urocaniciphilum]|uniref:Amino acid/polyamine/organocation transporter, APC superfamily n=1 Tax=Flavobacterium urocaniciphilum TaxID=1299341 RepID=A0A1H9B343_9FLAO|nr:amino acid permease [Flavobacterium urocaniciphilum]SEP83452.1 amino acid/polyamine/organocation transporter, APC superfamily [Flavobacterium urocaniciphilum]